MIYLAKIDKYPQEHLCPSTFRPVARGLTSLIPLKFTFIFYEFKVENLSLAVPKFSVAFVN